MIRISVVVTAVALACTGPPGPSGPEGPQGPQGEGPPGPLPTGCTDATIEQQFTPNMVGCDLPRFSDGGVIVLPIRDAASLCAPGWHICELTEWNAGRFTTVSQVNRYVRVRMTCVTCSGDVLLPGAVDLCDWNPTPCNQTWVFFVGPVPQDIGCANTWPAGINNGNVGRAATYGAAGDADTARAQCLTYSGQATGSGSSATLPIVGTMCCR